MNVKIDDYYQSAVESNALEGRDKYIMDRCDQLFAHLREGFNNMSLIIKISLGFSIIMYIFQIP